MNAAFAKLLILMYSFSMTGYVLLDGLHEALHTIKNELHHHEIKHAHSQGHHHHHVEDHQDVFTLQDESSDESKSTRKIFSLLLFYQTPVHYLVSKISGDLKGNGLFKK